MDGRFDRDYYERFYFAPASSVTSRAEMNARGRLIGACARHIGLPVKRLLDAGTITADEYARLKAKALA